MVAVVVSAVECKSQRVSYFVFYLDTDFSQLRRSCLLRVLRDLLLDGYPGIGDATRTTPMMTISVMG